MDQCLRTALHTVGEELRRWETLGATPMLWWRDDDAHRDSDQLRRLCRLVPSESLLLAIIPGLLSEDLVQALKLTPTISIAQHGWKHLNHTGHSGLSNEYPVKRSRADVIHELSAGQEILCKSFPSNFHRVFVPPWNRCAPWVLREASSLGFNGVSVSSPAFPLLRHGYAGEMNIEIDICDWTREGSFIGATKFAAYVVKALKIRREWLLLNAPIGILSHHACMTNKDFSCLNEFVALFRDMGVQWANMHSLFPNVSSTLQSTYLDSAS